MDESDGYTGREKDREREKIVGLIGIPSIVSGIVSIGQIEAIHFSSSQASLSRSTSTSLPCPIINYDFIFSPVNTALAAEQRRGKPIADSSKIVALMRFIIRILADVPLALPRACFRSVLSSSVDDEFERGGNKEYRERESSSPQGGITL